MKLFYMGRHEAEPAHPASRRASTVLPLVLTFALLAGSVAYGAVWTDEEDYAPGSVVTLGGDNSNDAGYVAGETVDVEVLGPNGYTAACEAYADEFGAWSCEITLWADERAIGDYTYTATGQASGVIENGTFKDAPRIGSVTASVQSPSPVTRGSSATYTVTVYRGTQNNSGGTFTATLSVSGIPAGANYSANPITLSAGENSDSGTLTVSTSGTTPLGSHPLTVTAVTGGPGTNDNASTSAALVVVAPDTTPPVITPSVSGTLGNNDWYTSDVSVTWTVSDPDSAVTSTTGCGSMQVNSDTTGHTFTCSATSSGGTNSRSVTIKRDATAPTISGSRSPGPNANGWNNTSVDVSFNCADALSGIASCGPNQTVSSEGSGQSAIGIAVDQAGNTASTTVGGINIDKTAPAVSASASPVANPHGWNLDEVTVTVSGTDSLSGIASCSSPIVLALEGADQTATGSCTDKAGNSASGTSSNINIDKTAPTIGGMRTPAPNTNGWNSTNVAVSFTCADALSGVASCGPNQTVSSEGSGQSATGIAVDKAGNSASATVGGINIDKTAPVVGAIITGSRGDNGWYTSDVKVTFVGNDSLSGVDACDVVEVATEGEDQEVTGSCTDLAGNSASKTVSVSIDKTAPTLDPNVTPNPVLLGGIAQGTANASDLVSGLASEDCGVPNTSSVGAKSVTCVATDVAGNMGMGYAYFDVHFSWSGFLRPVDNLPTVNKVKAGSAIPVKFSLSGDQGLGVFAAGFPKSVATTCSTTAPIDAIEVTVNAGGSSLSYDSTTDQYNYVWKTDKGWANTCRQLQLKLADGTTRLAMFHFTK